MRSKGFCLARGACTLGYTLRFDETLLGRPCCSARNQEASLATAPGVGGSAIAMGATGGLGICEWHPGAAMASRARQAPKPRKGQILRVAIRQEGTPSQPASDRLRQQGIIAIENRDTLFGR